MKFELGRYYKHTTGSKIFICGLADSIFYGRGLIAEDERGELSRVGDSEENTVNYAEITKEEFMEGIK